MQSLGDILNGIEVNFSELFKSFLELIGVVRQSAGEVAAGIESSADKMIDGIINGLAGIFIPDSGYIQGKFDSFLADIKMKFGVNTEVFESLFDGERPVEDVEGTYLVPGVGTFNLKFFDSTFFAQGVTYFRPFIRGFLVLLMLLYHMKQLIGFFGYDAGVVSGRSEHIATAKGGQKE